MPDNQEVLLDVGLSGFPEHYAGNSAEHARYEAVLLHAQARQVYEAAPRGMGRDDEDVIVAWWEAAGRWALWGRSMAAARCLGIGAVGRWGRWRSVVHDCVCPGGPAGTELGATVCRGACRVRGILMTAEENELGWSEVTRQCENPSAELTRCERRSFRRCMCGVMIFIDLLFLPSPSSLHTHGHSPSGCWRAIKCIERGLQCVSTEPADGQQFAPEVAPRLL